MKLTVTTTNENDALELVQEINSFNDGGIVAIEQTIVLRGISESEVITILSIIGTTIVGNVAAMWIWDKIQEKKNKLKKMDFKRDENSRTITLVNKGEIQTQINIFKGED